MTPVIIFGGIIFACLCAGAAIEWLTERKHPPVDPYAKYPLSEYGASVPDDYPDQC